MRRLRSLFKKLAISAASLAACLVVAELVARAAEPGPFSLVDRRPYVDAGEGRAHVRHEPGFEGRWDGTWYRIDGRGLRGPDREPTFEDGELRVVCLGDSCTFGKGVAEEDTWPRQLEALLRADAPEGVTPLVFNLGINGGSGRVYRELYEEEGAALRPHVVVVGYNLNDFPNTIRAVDEKVFGQRRLRRAMPKGLRDFFNRSALYRWMRATYYEARRARDWESAESLAAGAAAEDLDSEVWREQRAHLEAIRDGAREHGGHTVVFLFPYESQVYLDAYDRTPIERLGEVCGELGIPFVDLAEEFRAAARATDPPRKLFLRGDRYHPRPAGYAIVAERVRDVLEREGWLPGGGERGGR